MIRDPIEPELRSPDADFRRAFPLDSRSVWIEQQQIHGIVVPRENLPIGPGDYSPVKSKSHIGTPLLGSRDHFKTFEGNVPSRSTLTSRQGTSHSPKKHNRVLPVDADVEMRTIFYDHNTREPLDPKNRRTATPGPRLAHTPMSNGFLAYDGKHSVRAYSFGPNDIPFGERMPSRLALPDYHVKDDIQTKRVALGYITDEERFIHTFNKKVHEVKPHNPEEVLDRPWRRTPTAEAFSKHQKMLQEIEDVSLANAYEMKVSRRKPKVTLDKSAYRNNTKIKRPDGCRYSKLESLDPLSIDKKVRINPFKNMLTLRRQHMATNVGSKVSETLLKYADEPS